METFWISEQLEVLHPFPNSLPYASLTSGYSWLTINQLSSKWNGFFFFFSSVSHSKQTHWTPGGCHGNLWFINSCSEIQAKPCTCHWHPEVEKGVWNCRSGLSEAWVTIWTSDWHLRCVCVAWGLEMGSDPLTCGIWCYLSVDGAELSWIAWLNWTRWCLKLLGAVEIAPLQAHTH